MSEQVWKSDLNAGNKTTANNTWAAAVFRYFCGVVRWTQTDMKELDKLTRRVMAKTGNHHVRAAVERVHLPRKRGGRGVTCIEHMWEREVVACVAYLAGSEDNQTKGVVRFLLRQADLIR